MARIFTGSSSLYMTASSVPVTDEPLTMSIWVYPTNLTADWSGYFVLTNSGRTQYYEIRTWSAFDYRPAFFAGGTTTSAITIHQTLMATNTWQHLTAVAVSASERYIYRNGVVCSTPSFTNIGDATPTLTDVGVGLLSGSRSRYARAWLAEPSVWSAALSTTEVQALYKRASPVLVRPESLESYWPVIGRLSPERALVGGYDLTVVGSPAAANHPTIYRPMRLLKPAPPGSTGPITQTSSIVSDAVIQAFLSGSITANALVESGFQPRHGVSMPSSGVFMV